ncbi:MAG: hypothetical protein KF686_03505 [Ramlibacter sp.]|nr:hypothetical protein [Ramlibacter sp.]
MGAVPVIDADSMLLIALMGYAGVRVLAWLLNMIFDAIAEDLERGRWR